MDYDHFIIVKEVNQKREFLGAFSQFETTDLIKKSDMGLVSYHIIPVFKNYDVGSSLQSNSIILDPQEFSTDILPI
jgi:histone acetyltransferase (RNA polymerase elongator complex component)